MQALRFRGTLTVVKPNGCDSSIPKYKTIYRNNPRAAIATAGSTTFCSGTNPLTLTANAGASLTYQWGKENSNISRKTNQSFVPNATANSYKVIVTNTTDCSKT